MLYRYISYHSFDNLAKNNMSTIKPWCLLNRDEELRSIGILASIGHGQPSSTIMLQFEVLISEAISIDTAALNKTSREFREPDMYTSN